MIYNLFFRDDYHDEAGGMKIVLLLIHLFQKTQNDYHRIKKINRPPAKRWNTAYSHKNWSRDAIE
jgi:hypothetical protein